MPTESHGTALIADMPFRDSAAIHARLLAAFPQIDASRTHVGVMAGDKTLHAGAALLDETTGFAAGCLTKLLTGRLLGATLELGPFRLDSPISEILCAARAFPEVLEGITPRHLLEHTHGLDDSRTKGAPLQSDGLIDFPALRTDLTASRALHRPGALHSYSNAGGWLMAAVLERLHRKSYVELLHDRLLAPMGLKVRRVSHQVQLPGNPDICPSTGNELALSASDVLRFLRYTLDEPSITSPAFQSNFAVPMPGWSGSEVGIGLGWKYYASGWVGHNSELHGSAVLLRLHPQARVGIVVASESHPPAAVAAALFGRWLPDLVRTRPPKALSKAAAAALDLRCYEGRYRTRALDVNIVREGDRLMLTLKRTGPSAVARELRCTLLPAEDNIFYCLPADRHCFPLLQFLKLKEDRFQFLWNGATVVPLDQT
jgi:CubicO group peptidase (beta-lactamase class C family)